MTEGVTTRSRLLLLVSKARELTIVGVLAIIAISLGFLSPAFFRMNNLILIIKQISIMGILATGMTFVIITGGIDLSVSAIMALAGVISCKFALIGSPWPVIVPLLVSMVIGVAVGAFNGVGIAQAKMPPFVMTLGTMMVCRGLALVYTNGRPIYGFTDTYKAISNGFIFQLVDEAGKQTLGIPNLIFFLIGVIIVGGFLLKYTLFGKWTYAIGGNESAARHAGIRVARVKLAIYTFCGALAGLAGTLMASRITSGNAAVAEGYELNAIAAVVIGGVSMAGGKGRLVGTIIGAILIGVINNGLDIMGISPFIKQTVQGLIILLAVLIDMNAKKDG
jgi:ribose/xylose/arabinose/galactoside ABC-type transport system permease subunit